MISHKAKGIEPVQRTLDRLEKPRIVAWMLHTVGDPEIWPGMARAIALRRSETARKKIST